MGCGLAGDGLMGGERVSDGLASRNQRYRVLRLMWWDWAMAASEEPGCLHVSTMWALNAGLYWRRCVRGGVRAGVSMVSACCEVDTIFRLWLSGLKVAGPEAYSAAVASMASNRAAAVHARSRAGMDSASARQRSSVVTEMLNSPSHRFDRCTFRWQQPCHCFVFECLSVSRHVALSSSPPSFDSIGATTSLTQGDSHMV